MARVSLAPSGEGNSVAGLKMKVGLCMGIKGKLIIAASAVVVVFVAAIVFFRSDAWALIRNKHYLPDEYEAMLLADASVTSEERQALEELEADIAAFDSNYYGGYSDAPDEVQEIIEEFSDIIEARYTDGGTRYTYGASPSEILVSFGTDKTPDNVTKSAQFGFELRNKIGCVYTFWNNKFITKSLDIWTISDVFCETSNNGSGHNYIPLYEVLTIRHSINFTDIWRFHSKHNKGQYIQVPEASFLADEIIRTEDFDEYFLDLEQGIAPFYGEKLSLRRIEKYIESKRKAEAKQQG